MKTEDLKTLGLNDDQIKSVQALHGKDIEGHKSALASAERERDEAKASRDTLQSQLDAANDTIAKFGDATPESIEALKGDVEKYQTEAKKAKEKYDSDIKQRDQIAWLDTQLGEKGYDVRSQLARQAIKANVMNADNGLPWREGRFFGFDDYMKAEKEKDNDLYMTAEEKKAAEDAAKKEEGSPYFAGKTGSDGKESSGKAGHPRLI